MKKTILILHTFLALTCVAVGQDLTLSQLISRSSNQDVIQSDLQIQIESVKLQIQQRKRIPLIYGEANLQRNIIVPTTPVPAIAFDPNAAPGAIMPMRFATDWTSKAGVQLQFDLFNPNLENAIKEARLQQQKAAINQRESNRTAENTLTNLYAQVVLAQNQYEVAKKVLDDYIETLDVLKNRYDAGRASQVEMNNALKKGYELELLEQEASLLLLDKKIAILPYANLDFNERFTTTMEELLNGSSSVKSSLDIESVNLDQQINQLKLRNLNRLAIPTFTLNGYLGTQFFNNKLNLFQSNNWYGMSYVNVSMRLPITESFQRGLDRKQLLLEAQVLDSKLKDVNSNDSVQVLQKNNQLMLLKQKVKSQEAILKLAEENVSITRTQVDEGTILINELNKEIESYLDQQKKLWQYEYDLLKKLLE